MISSARVTTLAIALLVAQGPRAAVAKRKNAPAAGSVTTAKKVSVSPSSRVRPTLSPKRSDAPKWSDPAAAPAAAAPTGGASTDNTAVAGEVQTAGATTVKPPKTKVYTFGAMDVEGKLKTPQLLYFLNRVKLELEMSAPDHRSFMKELERTAEDPSL